MLSIAIPKWYFIIFFFPFQYSFKESYQITFRLMSWNMKIYQEFGQFVFIVWSARKIRLRSPAVPFICIFLSFQLKTCKFANFWWINFKVSKITMIRWLTKKITDISDTQEEICIDKAKTGRRKWDFAEMRNLKQIIHSLLLVWLKLNEWRYGKIKTKIWRNFFPV